ncbi:hypothetical protein JTE90_000332 [Oedothorax gibbosus]|uniref:Uncharacterized protein n=1 Tax=Oedothorax gibbosus TaxID=931172 RepID=A0AAV6VRH0_9ARAC|nr:hypothetical protein JTE90_000332 [Oedothorax gibbosus]
MTRLYDPTSKLPKRRNHSGRHKSRDKEYLANYGAPNGYITMLFGVWRGIEMGWLHDYTGSYDPGFYTSGLMIAIGGLMLFFIPCVQSGVKKREDKHQYTVEITLSPTKSLSPVPSHGTSANPDCSIQPLSENRDGTAVMDINCCYDVSFPASSEQSENMPDDANMPDESFRDTSTSLPTPTPSSRSASQPKIIAARCILKKCKRNANASVRAAYSMAAAAKARQEAFEKETSGQLKLQQLQMQHTQQEQEARMTAINAERLSHDAKKMYYEAKLVKLNM